MVAGVRNSLQFDGHLAILRHPGCRQGAMARRAAAKKTAGRKKAVKRELIDTGKDKRYVRRGAKGRFDESDDVGRSLAQDRARRPRPV
jgi:hypothetical protein